MTILFSQSWDVIPGQFDEYSAFVTNEYNPTLEKLGLKLLGGYYVAVGEGPRITAVATIESQATSGLISSNRIAMTAAGTGNRHRRVSSDCAVMTRANTTSVRTPPVYSRICTAARNSAC